MPTNCPPNNTWQGLCVNFNLGDRILQPTGHSDGFRGGHMNSVRPISLSWYFITVLKKYNYLGLPAAILPIHGERLPEN